MEKRRGGELCIGRGVADKLERGEGGEIQGSLGREKKDKKRDCELLCSCISVMFPSFWVWKTLTPSPPFT